MGGMTNLAKQSFKMLSGAQEGFDGASLLGDTALGAATGSIPGLKIPGVTAGRGSFLQVFKQIVTKAQNGTISDITTETAGKMAAAKAVESLPGAAAGTAVSAAGIRGSSKSGGGGLKPQQGSGPGQIKFKPGKACMAGC